MKKNKFTPRQLAFIDAMVRLRKQKEAAIEAGYKPHSAAKQASRLLKNEDIRNEIFRRLNIISAKTDITVARIEQELARIAFSDLTQLFEITEKGTLKLKPFDKLTEEQRALISEVNFSRSGFKFKAWNKNNALEILAKSKGMLKQELVNYNVDLTLLSNEQLERIIAGEPIERVLQK